MACEEAEGFQDACTQCRKRAKLNTFWKPSGMLQEPFKGIPSDSLALLSNEERKAVEAHQLEVERKRSLATMRARFNTLR